MEKKWTRLILTWVALVLVIASCGTPTPFPTPLPDLFFPVGTFKNEDGWTMQFGERYSYAAKFSAVGGDVRQLAAEGHFNPTADGKVYFVNTLDPCSGIRGYYLWFFDGTKLTFKYVEDDCSDRKEVLMSNLGEWFKQP